MITNDKQRPLMRRAMKSPAADRLLIEVVRARTAHFTLLPAPPKGVTR